MEFNGTPKQNKWAEGILEAAQLDERQIDNLLRWAGPTMHSQGVMDVSIVIDNRHNLASYADSLGHFYELSQTEKQAVAEEAASQVRKLATWMEKYKAFLS